MSPTAGENLTVLIKSSIFITIDVTAYAIQIYILVDKSASICKKIILDILSKWFFGYQFNILENYY